MPSTPGTPCPPLAGDGKLGSIMTIYRDPKRAAVERIAALERAIAARSRLLTPFVRSHLPAALNARLELFAERPADEDPVGQAAQLEAQLEALEQARALLPRIQQDLLVMPGGQEVFPRRPDVSVIPLLGEVSLSWHLDWITSLIGAVDPAAPAWIDGSSDYGAVCAALRAEGEPLGLMITCYRRVVSDNGNHEMIGRVSEGTAWTRLALGTPPVEVYPQGYKETLLLKPLRLRRDIELGDADFDQAFMIDGEKDAAHTLISGRVRRGLLAMTAAVGAVKLSIAKGGFATLGWEAETDGPVLQGAVEVLVGLRTTSIEPLLIARGF